MSKRRRPDKQPNERAAETQPAAVPAPSRSQSKRDAKAVVPFVLRLVTLTPDRLKRLELAPDLHDEIIECQRLTRAARKRQLKRIAGILRKGDWRAIERVLSK